MPRALRALLGLALLAAVVAVPATAAPTADFTYVTTADGVRIAVSITYPDGYNAAAPEANPNGAQGWPTLLQMDGYGGGADDFTSSIGSRFGNRYVVVYASIRGTGCSSGRFDLFDRVHAEDGKTIIDEWLPQQPWFNGDVGIVGHSYPGLTGWLVASTQPRELDVIALSGLIDELYRGIVYPGGVPNYGFTTAWTAGFRPLLELSGNADRYSRDPECARNVAARAGDAQLVGGTLDNPVVQGLTSQEDDTWWQVRSTVAWIRSINKPIHMTQQWQDEQTGPRGANVLWERLGEQVPKRMVLTNGIHSTTSVGRPDALRWLDCWTYGDGDARSPWCGGDILDPSKRVRIHFEQQGSGNPTNAPYVTADWPMPETDWTRYYLRADGSLTTSPPAAAEASRSYVSTAGGRQVTEELGLSGNLGDNGVGRVTFTSGPDALAYEVAFDDATAIAGPINLTLTASSTAPNTDFFVDLVDVAPDGTIRYLQRGLQRASHRAIDRMRSDFVDAPANPNHGAIYRAHHPHTNTQTNLLTPGTPEQFEIEVFPVGHVFRAGHSLRIVLHAPPPKDPLSIYAWVPQPTPAVNTVYHTGVNGLAPSSILLPVMPTLPPIAQDAPPCEALTGVICFKPVA